MEPDRGDTEARRMTTGHRSGPAPCDAFLALPASDERGIASSIADALSGSVGRLWLADPDGRPNGPCPPRCQCVGGSAIEALETALGQAADAGRALLVVLAPVRIGQEALQMLFEALAEDPMLGIAVPRVGTADGTAVLSLSTDESCAGDPLDRRVLGQGARLLITADLLAPCFLLRAEVVSGVHDVDAGYPSLGVALEHYVARVRRLGFRTVVTNAAVVTCASGTPASRALPVPRDRRSLYARFPEVRRARTEYSLPERRRFEALFSSAVSGGQAGPSLLLDVRNLGARHDGTSYAALGLCDGIRHASGARRLGLLAGAEGRAFHEMDRRFAGWAIHESPPDDPYAVAVRLSQPWHVSEIRDLHLSALANAYLMLDTIAWDVIYAAPEGLDLTWTLVARHADALLFISDFTRQRFLTRFPDARARLASTCRLSCDPRDYHRGHAGAGRRQHLLIVGNDLDHKAVAPTARLLANAFPFDRIVAVGATRDLPAGVQALSSGLIPEAELDALYADAWAIVFPSHYEGFGFPVVHGLAADVPVLARRSALLEELAAHYRGPGRLVGFTGPMDLVESLGRLKHGRPVEAYAFGSALADGEPASGWDRAAQTLLELSDQMTAAPSAQHWFERERTLRMVQAR
jgi:glycosyltransferase involved in cell wall biosynthesis